MEKEEACSRRERGHSLRHINIKCFPILDGRGVGGQHSSNMSQFNMISHQVASDSDTARDDTGVRDGRRLIEYHG